MEFISKEKLCKELEELAVEKQETKNRIAELDKQIKKIKSSRKKETK